MYGLSVTAEPNPSFCCIFVMFWSQNFGNVSHEGPLVSNFCLLHFIWRCVSLCRVVKVLYKPEARENMFPADLHTHKFLGAGECLS